MVFGCLIFFSCDLDEKSILGKFICNKFFVYLGSISYSIYMCHLFVFWILNNILKNIFNFKTFVDDDGFSKLDLNIFNLAYWFYFIILLQLFFALFI